MIAEQNSGGEGNGPVGIWGGRFQREDTAGDGGLVPGMLRVNHRAREMG